MSISPKAYHHVRITVRDIAVSRKFYDDVFGFEVAYELPDDADEKTREQLSFLFGGVIYQFPGGLFGLRPVGDDSFDEDRTGLDHLSFLMDSYAELEDAVATLDRLGIEHEPIKDAGGISIVEFRDPDNIALELTAPSKA
ncbi:VOC family protein [Williamsia sp. SKLECPSW1]